MRIWFLAIFLAGVQVSTPALAETKLDISSRCIDAIDEGEDELARELAEDIKTWKNLFGPSVIKSATDCLTGATGEHWEYFTTKSGFLSGDAARSEREYIDGADHRRAALERLRADAVCAQDRAIAHLSRVEEEMELAAEAREAEARAATHDACSQLYDEDRSAALLSSVCYDVFVRHGLPASAYRVNIDEWSEAVSALISANQAYAEAFGIRDPEKPLENAACNDETPE